MSILRLVLLFTLFFVVNCECKCQKTFKKVLLAPKYFDYSTTGKLKVEFKDKSETKCGNKITELSAHNPPTVTYNAKKPGALMSIIMFDPDVPTPPHLYLHWLIVNIPAEVMQRGYTGQAGQEVASYFPLLDPLGNHRYTFCVYYQNKYIKTCKKYAILDRNGVNPRSLAKQYDLQNAVACNFFYATAVNVPLVDKAPGVDKFQSLKSDIGNQDKPLIR